MELHGKLQRSQIRDSSIEMWRLYLVEGSSGAKAVVAKGCYLSVGRRVSHNQLGVCLCHILVVAGDLLGPHGLPGWPEIWPWTQLPFQDFDRDDTLVLIADEIK